jgi:hypothetical protein
MKIKLKDEEKRTRFINCKHEILNKKPDLIE